MSQVFILQNQNKYFLNKHREWVDGHDAGLVFRTPHRDIALNEMIEVNSKDVTQRIRIMECDVNSRNHPLIDEEDLPPPAPKEEPVAEGDTEGSSELADQNGAADAELSSEPNAEKQDEALSAEDDTRPQPELSMA
ncbi:MAG: hypothetical protein K6L73_14090 [Cellvibrionaceae bacterium]